MTNPRPVLYSFRRCPFAMRARMALKSAGYSCSLREVVLADKPDLLLAVSPKGTVPVLVLPDGHVIDESLDIMVQALRHSDPEKWLIPETGTYTDMIDLIRLFDGDFKKHLDFYKYASRYREEKPINAKEHRDEAYGLLAHLNSRLQKNPWLFGKNPCLADFAIFPFIRQYANTDRIWFDRSVSLAVRNWLQALMEDERFLSIMKKYPKWQGVDTEFIFPDY